MALKNCIALTILIVGAFITGLNGGRPAPALADGVSYPWCTQKEELRCYYNTRGQCEEEVDYHGFCVNNPDYRPPNKRTARPVHRQ
jgi:hypothetical protein